MAKINVFIKSFSYKSGLPKSSSPHGGGFIFDCRCIENPGRQEKYKAKTGKDKDVKAFIDNLAQADEFFSDVTSLIKRSIDEYKRRGFDHLEVSFGCTGGQHRSVYFAERLAEYLKNESDLVIHISHREFPNI